MKLNCPTFGEQETSESFDQTQESLKDIFTLRYSELPGPLTLPPDLESAISPRLRLGAASPMPTHRLFNQLPNMRELFPKSPRKASDQACC